MLYKRHRFPAEIISYAVFLYYRFSLSLRDIREILAYRGIEVSYEAIRKWGGKFGQAYAHKLRKRAPQRGDKWHLDEVSIKINGQQHWLWRAVDQDGYEFDILVQKRRDTASAMRFFCKLLIGLQYSPRIIITDKLRSYGAAKRRLNLKVEHRQHKRLNNRIENSHQATRQQERKMRRFKSPPLTQRFLSIHGVINNLFKVGRYKQSANNYRQTFKNALDNWHCVTQQNYCV